MDLTLKKLFIHQSQSLSPIKTPPTSISPSHFHSSHPTFPIIAIAIIGISATAFLLLSYYIFIIKCCHNWHQINLLGRFSLSTNLLHENPLMLYTRPIENLGLDQSLIRSIPIFQFKNSGKEVLGERNFCECAICLNEFQEEEKLRIIPHCNHLFHIDCIDIWLQTNSNCPICRTNISILTTQFPFPNHVIRPSSASDFIGQDEDYVVIELGEENNMELSVKSISPSPRKLGLKIVKEKEKRFGHGSSMGDECIDMREKDDQFSIQPIRRSFSMDSANDRQLYLAIQEIVKQNEGCSSRVKRTFFPFGYGRGSRNAVLPIHLDP